MRESTVALSISLEAQTRRDGDVWLARCPPLDVFSQGSSKAEALAALREAVELWFESCIQRGVLDAALREVGFTYGQPSPDSMPAAVPRDYIEITVPAYIAARQLESSAPR